MSDETISDIRKRAWKTRRSRYGLHGHSGSYSRCPDCQRMREWLVRLHNEGTLSEGQAAKATGLHRIDLRKMADDMVNAAPKPPSATPLHGEQG